MSRPTKPKNINSSVMPANTWGQLRAFLAQSTNPATGEKYSQQWITDTLGGNVGGRSKYDIVTILTGAL